MSSSSDDDSADEDYMPGEVEESGSSDTSGESEDASVPPRASKRKRHPQNSRDTRSRRAAGPGSSGSANESSDDEEGDEKKAAVNNRADEMWKQFKDDSACLTSKATRNTQDSKTALLKSKGEVSSSGGDLSVTTMTSSVDSRAAASASSRSEETTAKQSSPKSLIDSSIKQDQASSSKTNTASISASIPSSLESRLKPSLGRASSSMLDPSVKASDMQSRLSASLMSGKGGAGGRSSGLAALMSKAEGKKLEASTLEKSHQDWSKFKSSSGIDDDLKRHNKDGYLEKQDFLQRAERRQWEQERSVRLNKPK